MCSMQRLKDRSDVTGFGSFDNSTCKRVLDHRTVLIMFTLALQTVTTAQMLSTDHSQQQQCDCALALLL